MSFGKLMFLGLMVFSSVAWAENKKPTLDPALCQYFVRHTPEEGVAFTPGVDVNGKPVVEAEVEDSQPISLPEKTEFVLTVDVAKYLNMNIPAGLAGEARLGTIAIDEGEVIFNGEPMSGQAQHELTVLCKESVQK